MILNNRLKFALISVAILASTAASASDDGQAGSRFAAPTPVARDGDWLGTLTLPSQATLRIAVHLQVDRDGIVRGVFDSLDQRIWNVPLDAVAARRRAMIAAIPGAGMRRRGAGSASGRKAVRNSP